MQLLSHPETINPALTELCHRVVAHLGVEYTPSHLVLDAVDYTENAAVLDEFKDIAFSWTPDRPRDRVPQYLLELMRDPACTHLVWLSRRAIAFTEELFVWVLSHELRHIYQTRHGFPRDCVRNKVQELRRATSFMTLPPSIFAPEEIDSELCALRTVEAMFGSEELNAFLGSVSLPRCPYPAYVHLLHRTLAACPS